MLLVNIASVGSYPFFNVFQEIFLFFFSSIYILHFLPLLERHGRHGASSRHGGGRARKPIVKQEPPVDLETASPLVKMFCQYQVSFTKQQPSLIRSAINGY